MKPSPRNQLFVMMILEIAIWGAWQPKIFSYMGMLNFEPWQQALVGSVFGIASILGIFFSNQFADRNFAAEKFLAFSHLIGGLALVGAAFSQSFYPFFATFLLYGLLYVPTISVTNSLAFANLANPAKDFGFVRMGGTVGWIVVSWPFVFLVGEKATAEQVRWIFLVGAILSFVMAAFSLTLPHTPPRRDAAGLDRLAWVRAMKLLGTPFVLVLFIVTFLDSVIHNGYFVVSDAFLTNRVGIAGNLSMVVMSLGQVAEIVTMLVLGRVLVRLGWKWTMIIGILGHAARFATFAYLPDVQALIIVVQLLHGICYAFFFASVYIFVDEVFPKDVRASAQGLFNLLILGIGMVVASFLFPKLQGEWVNKPVLAGLMAQPAVTQALEQTEAGRKILAEPSLAALSKYEPIKQQVQDAWLHSDWHQLFLLPTGLAIAGMLLLALFFRPPKARPEETGHADSKAPMVDEGGAPSPP
ncbi:MAG TPA: MFS transporter [Chthoniobacteraceae bacterium]|jgi:MFS family permease|nr:MFS transporter [Chthoniobacteraceae bacterium]